MNLRGNTFLRDGREFRSSIVARSLRGSKRWITIGSLLVVLIISSLVAIRVVLGSQSTITVNVTDKSGIPLLGVSVQGFMETAKAGTGATGLTEVFNGTTSSLGVLIISDLSKIMTISTEWVNYQGASAKYFSPRVLLFLTYSNATGSLFFEQDSVPLTTLDFLNHQSANVIHQMDLFHPVPNFKLPKLSVQTEATTNSRISSPLPTDSTIHSTPPMTLPAPPSPGLADEWFLGNTDGPYPSACCTNIPIAWGQVFYGAYASMSVTLLAAQTDDLNTGYATGQGYQESSPTYNSGSSISSFQNQAVFSPPNVNLNLCVSGGSCSPSTGEIWLSGQFEGDSFALYACCDVWGNPIYTGENAYVIGIVNVPVDSGGHIQGGEDYNLPSYASASQFGLDYFYQQVGGTYAATGNPSPQFTITSYDVAAKFDGNQVGWVANLGLTGLGFLGFIPGAEATSQLGGVIMNLVGPIGSQSTSTAVSSWHFDAPLGMNAWATSFTSYVQWQISGMSSTGFAPIEGFNGKAYYPGGGGCVLSGTSVTLADGKLVPVDTIEKGQKLQSYDTETGRLVTTTVYNNTAIHVDQVVDINNGFLYASGLNDQPIYVQLQNGTQRWIQLGQLRIGMKLFKPVSGMWIDVTSVEILGGNFTVYDLRSAPTKINNYIANGVLLDYK